MKNFLVRGEKVRYCVTEHSSRGLDQFQACELRNTGRACGRRDLCHIAVGQEVTVPTAAGAKVQK